LRAFRNIQSTAGLRPIVALAGLLATAGAGAQENDDFHLGEIEYEISCLSCHGIDGRGDGPDAAHLDTKPADLTSIARANGGVFPAERLALVIDGRELLAAHGAREMPVWGERYRVPVPGVEGEFDFEADARAKIDALVRYIEGLQE
jgi:mono/diheme cytochrome c family protein